MSNTYSDGFNEGYTQGEKEAQQVTYAAILYVLKDRFGARELKKYVRKINAAVSTVQHDPELFLNLWDQVNAFLKG